MRCQEMCRVLGFFTFSLGAGWNANPWGSLIELTYVTSRPEKRNDTLYIYIYYILTYIHIPMYRHVSVS